MTPRGIRNNNPGNLRRSPDRWQGLAENQPDAEFFTFTAPKWGIRALAATLRTYVIRHRLATVAEIVARWAPPNGEANGRTYTQPTEAYISSVSRAVGVASDFRVDWQNEPDGVFRMVRAIIAHENGRQPYSDALIREGVRLAGWEQPAPSVGERAAKAAPVAAGAAVVTAGAISLADVLPHLPALLSALNRLPDWAAGLVAAAILIGFLVAVFRRRIFGA